MLVLHSHAVTCVFRACIAASKVRFYDSPQHGRQQRKWKKPALTRVQNPKRQFFVPRDIDLRPFDPKINGFRGHKVEHFCVKFGDPSCIGLL